MTMKTNSFISSLVTASIGLSSIFIMRQSSNLVNYRYSATSVEHTSNLLSSQAPNKPVLLQASLKQPVTTAGISIGWVGGIFLVLGAIGYVIVVKKGIVVIKNDEVGIVIKKFNLNPLTPKLQQGHLIALHGEAGSQAKVLAPGSHWGYFPHMYTVRKEKAIQILPEEIGLVVAKDGANISPEQVGQHFGKPVECKDFQDAVAFIQNGGQKGKQLAILQSGTYRINTELFEITKAPVINVSPDEIGLVVAKDGADIPSEQLGQLFGKPVECNNFQDADAFIKNGGQKGKQLAILQSGTYRINTELFEITKNSGISIPPDKIGLVVANDGATIPLGRQLGKVVNCNDFQDAHAFIQNGGERGKQLAILKPGEYDINTELFSVYTQSVINIPQGEIGLVVALDGANKPEQQQLGKVVECNNFQDAYAFIQNGGQKGRQLAILTSGVYQINTNLFTVITAANATQYGMNKSDLRVYTIEAGNIGIVTTYDGIPIQSDEIAGAPVDGHNNFQNGQKFIDGKGRRGLQEEILPPGSWNINPWFASVEQVELTDVPVGSVGVVISQVGKHSENKDGVVEPGYRGVWNQPLRPGKHVINTKVMDVEIVPTQPITLDWSNKKKPSTNYDASLNAIKLCSKDGSFHFHVEVTQVIRVPEEKAPTMIYRVGKKDNNSANSSIKALIVKILQPAVENYFRDSAQNSEALDFLDQRNYQARQAHDFIKSALNDYGVEAEKTLIGEIDLPDNLLHILTERKMAEEERKTMDEQRKTEKVRLELARELAETKIQESLVIAQKSVEIAQLEAMAQQYRINLEIERTRELREIELVVLAKTIDIIGREGWLDIEKLKELVKLQLPEVWVNNSSDGGSGLIDAVMPQVLRTLKNSTNGSSNGLSTHQTSKTLETSSTSNHTLPAAYPED